MRRRGKLRLDDDNNNNEGLKNGQPRYQAKHRAPSIVLFASAFGIAYVAWRSFWRVIPVVHDPKNKEHSYLEPLNSLGECGYRDPSSLLVLRVPKSGSTSLSNKLTRVSRATRRFKVKHLPEWTMAVGPIPNMPFPRRDPTTEEIRKFRFGIEATIAPDRRRKMVYLGHVFHVKVSGVGVVGLAREPQQRLASGYYYSSRRRLANGETTMTPLEECVSDGECVRNNDLGRLCSLHSLYYCGHHPDCGLDPVTRVATDKTVELAIRNINSSGVLLVVPLHRLDADGLPLLQTLLPTFFQDYSQERKRAFVPYDRDSERRSPPDHFGKNKSTGMWRIPRDDSYEKQALDDLCRQDSRVFAFLDSLFQTKLDACRPQM